MSTFESSDVDTILTSELQAQRLIDSHIVPEKPATDRSVWGYFKLFIWTAISSVLNCSDLVFEQPFDDHWPIDHEEHVTEGVHLQNGPVPSLLLTEDKVEISSESFTSATIESICLESNSPLLPTRELKAVLVDSNRTKVELNWNLGETCEVLCAQQEISDHSSSFTVINTYDTASQNGLIDKYTYDRVVADLIFSVIPRNLSDSSDVTVKPSIRKMYAWNSQTNGRNSNTNEIILPNKLEMESNASVTDEQLAYPGKLTMSDTSFSPLSPATTETSTITGDNCTSSLCDLDLPDIDRRDHTLAWAVANAVNKPIESDSHQSSPSIAQKRQSRDKSPVTTINSMRLPDAVSMPVFMPFDGFQLYQSHSLSVSEFETLKPKRSSSLKTQRTPPGTPGQKVVRFADAFGLDLTTVRHIFDHEAPPKIPASATFDLQLDTDESIAKLGAKQFGLSFSQPGSSATFIRRVLNDNVCLEDAHIDMSRGVLTGTIRVKSLTFEKRVLVRITYNNWVTYFDSPASYVHGSHDGATDRFSFSLVVPNTMTPGDRAQFAIRYETSTGDQFWDNNHGQNYVVTCYAQATDLAGDGSWMHYL